MIFSKTDLQNIYISLQKVPISGAESETISQLKAKVMVNIQAIDAQALKETTEAIVPETPVPTIDTVVDEAVTSADPSASDIVS